MQLQVIYPDHPHRAAVTAFVRSTYRGRYGARLPELPAMLCAHFDLQGLANCAAALRSSKDGFFSETYLSAPVEQVLTQQTGLEVERRDVVEVSSLVSRDPRACLPFITALIRHGASLGFGWTFFTATEHLSRLLQRLGLPLIDLGAAAMERVSDPRAWGSYYATKPRVFAIHRASVLTVLDQRSARKTARATPRPTAQIAVQRPLKPCPALAFLAARTPAHLALAGLASTGLASTGLERAHV